MRSVTRARSMYRISRNRGVGPDFHLAHLVPKPFPMAHANLTKNPGDLVTVSWPVSNLGDVFGKALIEIDENGVVLAQGDEITVQAGAVDHPVITRWTIPQGFPQGLHNLTATLFNDNSGGPHIFMASHPFTVTIPTVSTGPNLVPLTGPTIPEIF